MERLPASAHRAASTEIILVRNRCLRPRPRCHSHRVARHGLAPDDRVCEKLRVTMKRVRSACSLALVLVLAACDKGGVRSMTHPVDAGAPPSTVPSEAPMVALS